MGKDKFKKDMTYIYNRVIKERTKHVETFAAAFFKEMGTEEASKYKLVETHQDNTITWSFEPL